VSASKTASFIAFNQEILMNQKSRFLPLAGAVTLAAALTACGTVDPYGANNYPVTSTPSGTYSQPYSQPVAAVEYGRVTNVSLVSGQARAPRGNAVAGAVIGGIIGGLLGNQVGGGTGKTAATVLGAAGGAVVGSNIARRSDGTYATNDPVYRIEVQTDQGAMRVYDVAATGDLRPGDRVRIENGVIYHG
jgi:outer membrane lipoprotein SlyB